MSKPWKVVIVGGGFGGLNAAQQLKSDRVDVTLIDRRNYHLFQPLLYQVATGSLAAGEIAAPLRSVFRRQKNTRVLLGNVVDVDPDSKHVFLEDGAILEYDSLIVCRITDFLLRAQGMGTMGSWHEERRRSDHDPTQNSVRIRSSRAY
jgi:NADH dehydrogenase